MADRYLYFDKRGELRTAELVDMMAFPITKGIVNNLGIISLHTNEGLNSLVEIEASGQVRWFNNGIQLAYIASDGAGTADFTNMGKFILPVKTDTGDPTSPTEGQVYVNTFDNNIRCYADGAWRNLATW